MNYYNKIDIIYINMYILVLVYTYLLAMSAYDIIDINRKPIVHITNSKISGYGLFAKKHIHKNTPVVIYYGNKITDADIYNTYENNVDEYCEISKYTRGTPNGYAINGCRDINNLNLVGVYVNDISKLDCTKDNITYDSIKKYTLTKNKCNVKVVDTKDYPIYMSTKRIKKNEEIYVHYGIGYWLLQIGCTPEDISMLNRKYNFSELYS